ncbi:hypothetical protein [Escherichia coli]|uniref:hypothetical protein n=1 Tax=Escherichia coli TaxID=562 RepID=UPI003AFA0D10
MPLQRSESSSCRPLHRGFSPQWTFPMGARLPPHGTAVRGRTQNFLPGSWLKILWPVHLTLDRWNGRGLRLPPGKSTAGNRPQRWRQEGRLLRHQAQFPHTPSGVQGAQVTARQGRRDRNGRCKPDTGQALHPAFPAGVSLPGVFARADRRPPPPALYHLFLLP